MTAESLISKFLDTVLALLHSEQPKLFGVLAVLSAIGSDNQLIPYHTIQACDFVYALSDYIMV